MKRWNNLRIASLFFFLVLVSSITITISAFAADSDSDGIEDDFDNCPTISNPDQRDTNN